MCYICSCFAWGLDLLQRVITFGLLCVLCCSVCFGLSIAIIAGIAYGYNYSMAEFITFTRSDVTVFMRRGQFGDSPGSANKFRRTGDGGDIFNANAKPDYDDHRPVADSKPLSDTWLKTQDTRKYAEILTRYSPNNRVGGAEESVSVEKHDPSRLRADAALRAEEPQQVIQHYITPESPKISMLPNPLIPTVSWRSGSSEIMMRNFKPLDFTTSRNTEMPESLFVSRDNSPQSISILSPKEKAKGPADTKLRDDFHKSYVPMRVWGTTTHNIINDEATEEIDEDIVVYKSV